MSFPALTSVAQVRNALGGQSYLADEGLATAVFWLCRSSALSY